MLTVIMLVQYININGVNCDYTCSVMKIKFSNEN